MYMYIWVPNINISSGVPEDDRVGRNKMEDNETELWVTTSVYLVGYNVTQWRNTFNLTRNQRGVQSNKLKGSVMEQNSLVWIEI
jgi:hypothetical protein